MLLSTNSIIYSCDLSLHTFMIRFRPDVMNDRNVCPQRNPSPRQQRARLVRIYYDETSWRRPQTTANNNTPYIVYINAILYIKSIVKREKMIRATPASFMRLRRGLCKTYPTAPKPFSSFLFSSSDSRRWSSSEETARDENNKLFYEAPMGRLISRLKVVSITSCVCSVIGLPLLIYIKNGDFPNMREAGMGGIAFFGASGSTLALHFVFGPYALTMEKVSATDESSDADTETTLIKATTRSVFGWKNEIVFDPLINVMPYSGMRPFANFIANDVTLYAHPDLLDDAMRQRLLFPLGSPATEETERVEKNEGLPAKKKWDDDDDLF